GLALAAGEPADPGVDRGHVDGEGRDHLLGLALHRAAVEEGQRADLADELPVEEEVLPDGEVLDEREVLVDGLDPGLAGVLGGGQLQLVAVEDDGAGVGVVDAADAADEGGLAGAVVTDERGDLPATQGERDLLEGLDAAEGEGDV